MSAFMDGTCPRCKKRFGWTGDAVDRPPCPGCGHQVPRAELEADDAEMKRFEEELLKRKASRAEKLLAEMPAGRVCERCGGSMIHSRLHGYQCAAGCQP